MEGLFDMENLSKMIIEYAPKVVGAVLTLIIGFWIANAVARAVKRLLGKNELDDTVTSFLGSLVSTGIKVMVLIAVAGIFGVETTSIVAIFGAMAFAVGMALQGSLGHFASGVLLLTFKPYKVGDLVNIGGGNVGTVKEIQIFNTILATLDNKRIIVPNGVVTSNVMTNISGQGVIGVELSFGIGYDDDIDKAKALILQVGKECPYILDNPAQGVVVSELGDSAVVLATRPFAKSENYWNAYFYMQENVKKTFDKEGVSFPYPQMDVHTSNN